MIEHKVTAPVGDKEISIGSGNITKQADGTVTVQMGETIVMTAVVAATKGREGPVSYTHLTLPTIYSV